jgi:PAS domain S-box-containing protein
MAQILNSLVVSDTLEMQRSLETIMANNQDDYALSFTSYAMADIDTVDREPDLIFLDSANIAAADIQTVVRRFPKRTVVALDNDPELKRRAFLRAGADEVMSMSDLQSDIGKHFLEKLMAWKELAAAEELVERSEERFRDIIEYSHDMIVLLDDTGTILYASPATGRQMGYENWEVLGQQLFDFVHEEDRVLLQHNFGKILSGAMGTGVQLEFQFRRSDGQWRAVEAVASNLLRNINVQSIVFNFRDVTEEKQIEIELENYRRHLEELVARRTRELAARTTELEKALDTERQIVEQQRTFVSMVSHEFRTPLTIIDGNAQIIVSRGDKLDKAALEKRGVTIRSAVDRLIRLIETVLSGHMLDSGKLQLDARPCNLGKLVRDISAEQQDISPTHVITVKTAALPDDIHLDEKLMRHVLTNLLSNAVKYSPGKPDIEIKAFPEDDWAIIQVTDSGVGIPPDEMPKIFGKYFRASTSGGIPGSGLGLSLVKQFVEMHQGHIDLKSQVGQGTTVTVKLPVSRQA